MELYPLKFYEIYKPKIWGGRAIETVLGKRLTADNIGESWELSDHFDDVSVVRNGPLEGRSLRDLLRAAPSSLLGEALASKGFREFPLLVKFIHAEKILSVQVHPDDEYAGKCDPDGESGKNEAWHVLAADPGAQLVLGVKEGTTKEDFLRLLEDDVISECLNYVEVAAGDTVHIAAGTVHSVGPGILLFELQQTSDATYRLWDWGRLDADGGPRPLHIERAVSVIDFERGPVGKLAGEGVQAGPCRREVLDRCEFFVMEKIRCRERFVESDPAEEFYILTFVAGSGGIVCAGERYSYARGDTVLIPASLSPVAVEPAEETTVLKTYIP